MIFITTLGACLGAKNCFCENTEFDLTHPSGLRSPVTSTNGENRHGKSTISTESTEGSAVSADNRRNRRDAEHHPGSA